VNDSASGSGPNSQPPPPPDPCDHLEHQLELVVSSRIGEDQVTWTIFRVFWAAQVLLVGVLLQGPSFPPHPLAGLIVSILGVFMSTAWGLTQGRSLSHLERFEGLTKSIEVQLQKAGHLHQDHCLTMAHRFPGLRARTAMRVCCWGAALAWFTSAVVFGCCVCRCGLACSL